MFHKIDKTIITRYNSIDNSIELEIWTKHKFLSIFHRNKIEIFHINMEFNKDWIFN